MASEQPTLFDKAADEQLAELRCPKCGYRPLDDVLPDGQLPRSMLDVRRLEPPTSREEALDYFDCIGADEGCVFCNRCGEEFCLETGESTAWNGDD